jgi:hypothetical protein
MVFVNGEKCYMSSAGYNLWPCRGVNALVNQRNDNFKVRRN